MSPADLRCRDSHLRSLPAAPEALFGEIDRRWSAPILCGVSDSDAGRAAAETAAGLAALLGTSVLLVRVELPVSAIPLRTRKAHDIAQRTRVHDARQIVERVSERCALTGLAAIDIAVGDPAVGLATMASRHQVWMAVIGAPRRRQRRLGHDVSQRLSALVECPVVVVPPPVRPAGRSASR